MSKPISPYRPRIESVPAPEFWFCWHCGSKTDRVRQHALGGYAEVICPESRSRVIGVPSRDLAKGDGLHAPRSARSPIRK